jgi:hypothetical protein
MSLAVSGWPIICGNGRPEHVGVEDPHARALLGQRRGQVGRDRGLAHAALARRHRDDVANLGQPLAGRAILARDLGGERTSTLVTPATRWAAACTEARISSRDGHSGVVRRMPTLALPSAKLTSRSISAKTRVRHSPGSFTCPTAARISSTVEMGVVLSSDQGNAG